MKEHEHPYWHPYVDPNSKLWGKKTNKKLEAHHLRGFNDAEMGRPSRPPKDEEARLHYEEGYKDSAGK